MPDTEDLISISESRFRSLAKAVSWRLAGSLSTVAIVYFFSGELDLAAIIGGSELVVKIGLFYVHERIWEHFPSYARIKKIFSRSTLNVALK